MSRVEHGVEGKAADSVTGVYLYVCTNCMYVCIRIGSLMGHLLGFRTLHVDDVDWLTGETGEPGEPGEPGVPSSQNALYLPRNTWLKLLSAALIGTQWSEELFSGSNQWAHLDQQDLYLHTTAAHWITSRFVTILCKSWRWWRCGGNLNTSESA